LVIGIWKLKFVWYLEFVILLLCRFGIFYYFGFWIWDFGILFLWHFGIFHYLEFCYFVALVFSTILDFELWILDFFIDIILEENTVAR